MRADAVEDGRHARAGEIERGFPNRLRARHFAEEFGGVVLVGRKSNANLAVADDAFVAPVFVHDLANVLRDEVCLQAKPGHVGKRVRENLHALEGREFVNQEEQAMFVAELLGTLKIEFFGEPVNDHGKDQAHERTKPNLVARRNNEVERYWPFVIHEVLNRKVARGSGTANKRIAVKRQCRFRCGQDAGEILVLLVEHFLNFLFHDGMRARRFARGKPPVVCVVLVVCVGEKLGESFAEVEAGSRKDAGEQAEGCLPTFECGGVAHMQDHPGVMDAAASCQ